MMKWYVFEAVRGAVHDVIHDVVLGTVGLDVYRAVPGAGAVDGTVYWAMSRNVYWAVFVAAHCDVLHPSLTDFLAATGTGTP